MTTVGILGAGKLGTVLARLAVAADYRTLIAASGAPAAIELIVDVMAPGAVAVSALQVAAQADIVILALPLSRHRTIPGEEFRGKVVIDAMNYWPPADGVVAEFETSTASSVVVAQGLPGARLAKALSHLDYHQLDEDARPAGAPDRHAIAIAADDEQAMREAAGLVDRLGFDPVLTGDLARSARFGPGTAAFGASVDRAGLMRIIDATDIHPLGPTASGVTAS